MNQVYSAMATLLDEQTTIDDGTYASAETPVEYTSGKIDIGDNEPWYTSFDLMEHITGGALRTSGWTRAEDTNTGIVAIPITNIDIVPADRGADIIHDGDSDAGTLLEIDAGTLLEIIVGDNGSYLLVRPDSDNIANSVL